MMSETVSALDDLYALRIRDIMHPVKGVPHVVEGAALDKVLSLLKDHGYVWVVAQGSSKRLLGIITESDMIAVLSPPITSLQTFDRPDSHSLQFGMPITPGEIMSEKPVTASAEQTVRDVIITMKQFRVKQLPVVDHEGMLLGDVTLHQFIEVYYKGMV